ncbi:MAG TPA: ATP-dependent Clp protease proteolytic subunit [Thermodesulfobacteriota bacterium]|nr:ATP-dependent Clp protease proteolytic subunit [Deltaproteobacteria bacterium]HNR12582.1 ATP-dependent Clp protease proteolytic subunit [Thermodesulfobacteriota bacterium]
MSTRPWLTWLAAIPRLILWILIIGVLATMIFQQIQAAAQQEQRLALIREIQHERQSRVITLIHEKQLISILGIPFRGFIDIEDAEAILQVVRETPPDMPIDMIIHTPGGLALAATQIALALKSHQGRVTVFVPYYAMSGGTLLALAADEIVMDPYAVLGPVDPQLSLFPAVSIIEAVQAKPIEDVDDSTLIMADMAKKAIRQITDLVKQLLQDRMPEEKAEQIAVFLASGRFTHDYPITVSVGRSIGLPISTAVPDSVYRLVALYRKEDLESSAVTSVPRDETARNDLSLTRP